LAERGQLEPRPEEPKPTQQEVQKLYDKVQNDQKRLNEWKPRKLNIGEQIPPNGVPGDYDEGTPERKLVEFLNYWKQRNYGRMAECVMKMIIVKPVHVKEMYRGIYLDSFGIIAISDNAASQTDITVELVINNNNKRIEGSVVIGLIYQTADGSPSIRGKTDGLWWIQNWGHPIAKLIYHN
jgi:hypothetical protein